MANKFFSVLVATLLAFSTSIFATNPANCGHLDQPLTPVNDWLVIDGDTLILGNQRRLRLNTINTPELGRAGAPDQPMALLAKQQTQAFLNLGKVIYWQIGKRQQDHYGRSLGRVYNTRGEWLAAHLVARGLAFVVDYATDPPEGCLWQLESQARKAGKGVWQTAQDHAVQHINPANSGFMLLTGKVVKVDTSEYYWYIELADNVVLKINKKNWQSASGEDPQAWLGKQVHGRGWLAWRKLSKKQKQRGYKPAMMTITAPSMLQVNH